MDKEFIVFFEHTEYGYYTIILDAENIQDALSDFCDNYAHNEIYGIMEKK